MGHFLRRKYPKDIIKDAAILARGKDRHSLLRQPPKNKSIEDKNKVFLITTYHPDDQCVPDITRHNWTLLDRNQATDNLFHKKLTCGYRRPKNLRDLLCKAKVGKQNGDELADLTYVPPTIVVAPPTLPAAPQKALTKQTTIRDLKKNQVIQLVPHSVHVPYLINLQGSQVQ